MGFRILTVASVTTGCKVVAVVVLVGGNSVVAADVGLSVFAPRRLKVKLTWTEEEPAKSADGMLIVSTTGEYLQNKSSVRVQT